jgi:uncharacterized protein YndB with AHSA1/START domain
MLHVCPTGVVHASPDRIWSLLTTPRELAAWTQTTLVEAPDREIRDGDRLVLGAGPAHWFRVIFQIREAVRPHLLSLDIHLPLGVTNDEAIRISPIAAEACRVTFQ